MVGTGRRWIHSLLGPAACLVVLAACSQQAAPPQVTQPEPATTVAPVTTTTSAPTTTTQVDEEAAVRAAHLAYWEMYEVVGDPPDPDHPELARRATGDAYERLRASLVQARAAGQSLRGGWQSSVQAVEVRGDSAQVTDCLLDLGKVRDSDGEILVGGDSEPSLQSTELVRSGETWRVSRLNLPSDRVPCAE